MVGGFFSRDLLKNLWDVKCVKVDTFQFSQFSGGFKGHCT